MSQLYPYVYVLAAAAILAVVAFAVYGKIFNRLSTRIIVLILASGPLTAILYLLSTRVLSHFDLLGAPDSFTADMLYVLVTLGVPVVIGLLAAYFVRRPLRRFTRTVASVKQNNYSAAVKNTGVEEFDEVLAEFNGLVARLQHEEKLRKDLISDTSHELNTPLTTMIGQLIAMQDGKLPLTKERIGVVRNQAERLAELVRQLDAYTKARVPDVTAPEALLLRSFCQEITDQVGDELKKQKIHVRFDIPDDYIVHANPRALRQILVNLIQNTMRYADASEISITANARSISFADNGKGVPAESLPYLFERFYRVDESRSRATGGLGLGLAIVRELVESQGWTIAAEAEKPGLRFTIYR